MNELKRLTIRKQKTLSWWEVCDGKLRNIVDYLREQSEGLPDDVDFEISYSIWGDGSCDHEVFLYWNEPESDAAYAERVKLHKQRSEASRKAAIERKKREAKEEKALFLKLKQKYEQ